MRLLLDGLRILVLEDEFLIAMDVEQLCRDHGAGEVVIAGNLAEIDEDGLGTRFDAAIVDLMLVGKPYAGADLVEAVALACGRAPRQAAGDPIT